MMVPDRIEAARMVSSLQPLESILRHSRAVADVAAFLTVRTARGGVAVDGWLADAAAP
jgi:hypothetical protein